MSIPSFSRSFSTLYFLVISLIILSSFSLKGQDFSWWNETHNWDGVTPWNQYLTISPAFMGPNALPVPDMRNGLIPKYGYVKTGGELHFGTGDETQNLLADIYVPLFSDRIGIQLRSVPVEFFQMDSITRDERAVRDRDGIGRAGGDIYVSTLVQLVRNHQKWPDIDLGVHLRTASGTNLAAARYTDAPGYYFDVSVGKTFSIGEGLVKEVRPHFTGGFYVWQTYDPLNRQNDAPLYALGLDMIMGAFEIRNSLAGYYGYIGNGDRPLVYRVSLRGRKNFLKHLEFRYQEGLTDFPFRSFRIAYRIEWEWLSDLAKDKQ